MSQFFPLRSSISQTPLWQHIELFFLLACIIGTPLQEGLRNTGLFVFMLIWVINRIRLRDVKVEWDRWDIATGLLIASMLCTQITVLLMDDVHTKVSHVLRYLVLFWMMRHSRFAQWQYWLIVAAIVIPTLIGMGWSWPHYLAGHKFKELELPNIQHVNHASLYVLVVLQILVPTTVYLLTKKRRAAAAVLVGLVVLFMIWLMAASSRAAVGVAVLSIGVGVVPLFLHSRRQAVILLLALLVLGGAVITNYSGALVKQKAWMSVYMNKMSPRERLWNTAFESFDYAPWLGRGYDQYQQLTPDYVKRLVESKGEKFNADHFYFAGHAHNVYITWVIEHGVVGLSALVVFCVVWLMYLFKDYHRIKTDSILAWWWSIATSAFLTTTVAGIVTTTMRRDTAFVLLLVLGLYLSYSKYGAIDKETRQIK